jgi:hypothetical protein
LKWWEWRDDPIPGAVGSGGCGEDLDCDRRDDGGLWGDVFNVYWLEKTFQANMFNFSVFQTGKLTLELMF